MVVVMLGIFDFEGRGVLMMKMALQSCLGLIKYD
jgi:hypothetical protein